MQIVPRLTSRSKPKPPPGWSSGSGCPAGRILTIRIPDSVVSSQQQSQPLSPCVSEISFSPVRHWSHPAYVTCVEIYKSGLNTFLEGAVWYMLGFDSGL